jgi:hypothetical protein
MIVYPWDFAHVKYNHEEEFFSLEFSTSFKLWRSYHTSLKHLLVHYLIILRIVIFLSCKMFFHWKCRWAECCFYHLQKNNGFSNLIKNGNLLSNKCFKSRFIKLLVYLYTMIQVLINCILMGLITYFMFEV